jgi:hypothetical protein
MSKPTPAGYRPSGSQCAQCQHAAEDCSALDFSAMRPVGRWDADRVQRVACPGYVRAAACSECGQRGWHTLSCLQRPARAPQMPATRDDIPTLDEIKAAQGPLIDAIKSGWRRPCRCGPDGCADSVACPRHNRTDG